MAQLGGTTLSGWIIWFHADLEKVALYRQDETLTFIGDFALDEVAAHTGQAPLTGYLPTEQVSFIEVSLPKTSEKRLRLALPSLVEDAVASNPEENFYALAAGYQPGEACTLAVISLEYLQQKIADCLKAGLNLTCLTTDCFLLPTPQEGVCKLIDRDRIVVRTGAKQGFALQKHHAVLIMKELDGAPEFAPTAEETPPFNFLQGTLAVKPPKKPVTRMKVLYYALGGCFAAHILVLIILGSVLDQRLDTLRDKTLHLYSQAFPGALKVTSPKAMIERELKNYGTHTQDPFISLLASTSLALAQIEGVNLHQMDYQQQRLTLQLTLPNLDSLEGLTDKLSSAGLQVKPQQITEQDNTIRVDLIITRGES